MALTENTTGHSVSAYNQSQAMGYFLTEKKDSNLLNTDYSATFDSNGAVTDRVEYSPYGTVTYREGSTDTPFLYAGQFGIQQDANGLLYMRARYYNPEIRRFINADPIGFAGGMNWYAYAGNNPIMYVDPSGHVRWLALGKATLGMGVNTLGMAVGIGVAAIPEPSMATVAVGGTLALKSGYGFGANLSNATSALFDADPVSTGALTNDIAQAVAPGNMQAQQLATVVDLATDIGSARMISNAAINAIGKSPTAFPSLRVEHIKNPANLSSRAKTLIGASVLDSLIKNTTSPNTENNSFSAGFSFPSFNSNSSFGSSNTFSNFQTNKIK